MRTCAMCNSPLSPAVRGQLCPSCAEIDHAMRISANIRAQRNRAARLGLPATLTLAEWVNILRQHKLTCAYCNKRRATCIEHVVPIVRGGGTTAQNCVPACRACNARKGAKEQQQ